MKYSKSRIFLIAIVACAISQTRPAGKVSVAIYPLKAGTMLRASYSYRNNTNLWDNEGNGFRCARDEKVP